MNNIFYNTIFKTKIQGNINKESIIKKSYDILEKKMLQKTYTYNDNDQIPKIIYQTWQTHDLPYNMRSSSEQIKNLHPDFEYKLFDDIDCRNFIKEHFDYTVLHAYDRLIPGAYKADLWRYCILYITGGIYLDIKYICSPGFNFNSIINKPHWVLDNNDIDIYNALMICQKQSPILRYCIRQIVINVNINYYGKNALYPTGPGLLKNAIDMFYNNTKDVYLKHKIKNNIDMKHHAIGHNKFIYYNKKRILQMYENYYNDLNKYSKIPSYGYFWNKRQIYHPPTIQKK